MRDLPVHFSNVNSLHFHVIDVSYANRSQSGRVKVAHNHDHSLAGPHPEVAQVPIREDP
jgi:hypothetical protein